MIPVKNVGSVGIVQDIPEHELPLNIWTAGRNVRFRDGAVEKFRGHSEVYAGALNAPYFLLPIASGTSYYWLYPGLTKVGVTDGSTHADITRAAGGDYATDLAIGWTGTVINGVPVLNNGFDIPQMWATISLVTKLTALTAWDANWRANSMRSLKRYLVALDITKTGVRNPHMIKWSDAAGSTGVPASWDETSTTNDAGEWVLSAEGGFLVDSIPLRDDLVVYKESQTWLMKFVGGVDIFDFDRKFSTMGMIGRRCAQEFFSGKHLVFTGEDVVLHDGQQANSIISARDRSAIQGTIDSNNQSRSFVAVNYPANEVWVCYPETGNSLPNRALVWNWKLDTVGFRDLPPAAFIESGVVNPVTATETWNGAVGTWDSDANAWGDRSYDPSQRKMLFAYAASSKLYAGDDTQQFDGVNMTANVERTGLGFPVKVDSPPDYTSEKLVSGIWPHITGTIGGVVNVYLGTQDRIGNDPTWSTAFPFIIGTTEYCDFAGEVPAAKIHAIKFESTSNISWLLSGYDVDVKAAGSHGSR